MKALVYWPQARGEARRIVVEGLSRELELVWASSQAEALEALREAEIYIGSAQNWVLERGERLRFLQAVPNLSTGLSTLECL